MSELPEEDETLHPKVYPEEGRKLRTLAEGVVAPNVIVELGSYTGKSTGCLAVGSASGASIPVYAIDLWTEGARDEVGFRQIREGEERHKSRGGEFDEETWQDFLKRMKKWDTDELVVPIKSATQDEAPKFDQPIGLLFIDAEHKYEAVKRDFADWSPKVIEGGTICMHDYKRGNPQKDGVKRTVEEQDEWDVVEVVRTMAVLRRRA